MPDGHGELKGWLSPAVEPHEHSFLGRSVGRMSGPSWTMATWDLAMFAIMLVNVLALLVRGEETLERLGVALYWGVAGLAMFAMGSRARGWILHLLLDVNVLVICWISLTAATELRVVANLMFLLVPAVFAATWFPRRQMTGHLLVILLASSTVLLLGDSGTDGARVWFVLMAVCLGTAFFVNALVHHLGVQVTYDPLTGLLNRAGLGRIQEADAGGAAVGLPRSVVVLDLDGFKAVNDERGHQVGDDLLREVGVVMRALLRPDDAITRTGGDEFVLVLRLSDVVQTREAVRRLAAALPIDSSYGIADWTAGMPLEEAVKVADALMYEHKEAKRA